MVRHFHLAKATHFSRTCARKENEKRITSRVFCLRSLKMKQPLFQIETGNPSAALPASTAALPTSLVLFLPFLFLFSCAHLDQVEAGIRQRDLAGAWKSEAGGFFEIGCSGSFSIDQANSARPLSLGRSEATAHLSAVGEKGFRVSRFPLAGLEYSVEEWPHAEGSDTVMRAQGIRWRRVRAMDCR
jgi:hypothetical protein